MQEQRSKEAKKAVVTLLMSHMATPSSFPHPAAGEPWPEEDDELVVVVRTLDGSTELDLKLKKLLQLLLDVLVAAMNVSEIQLIGGTRFERKAQGFFLMTCERDLSAEVGNDYSSNFQNMPLKISQLQTPTWVSNVTFCQLQKFDPCGCFLWVNGANEIQRSILKW